MKLQDFDFRIWTGNKFTKQNDFKGYLNGLDEDVCEIELWTGYFDKNGNKIYENDILKKEPLDEIYYIARNDTYKMVEIIIYDKDCSNNLYRKKKSAGIELLKMLVSNKNMSVIGNIHENANLLGE
ncbi:YopX family protein [Campylobacter upsaliensis]|uniref:YopX family protein n=1 Tax=Campylobacter upsaliensis TaxID=28080 RepID=UPI00214A8611|nr:YopX family protein [Campylobacter upsaliensis]MCR2092357.1 YopX family protein [Campylobacter upsaliensis]